MPKPKPKSTPKSKVKSKPVRKKKGKNVKAIFSDATPLFEASHNQDDTPKAFKKLIERQANLGKVPKKPKPEKPISIRPGESMSDFSRRVNDAVPVPLAKGINSEKAEKTSQRQKKKAENLRAEHKRRLEKEDSDEETTEKRLLKKRDTSPDPWARIQEKNIKPKFGEVADRPPELVPLKPKGNVPKSAGSQARREVLEEERERFIAKYREVFRRG